MRRPCLITAHAHSMTFVLLRVCNSLVALQYSLLTNCSPAWQWDEPSTVAVLS